MNACMWCPSCGQNDERIVHVGTKQYGWELIKVLIIDCDYCGIKWELDHTRNIHVEEKENN